MSAGVDRAFRCLVAATVLGATLAACGGGRVDDGDGRPAADGVTRFSDPEVGLAGAYPSSWFRMRALTNLVDPREVLALATYPLRGRSDAGECAPEQARADLPRGGAFVWLVEYRTRGDLVTNRFPPRPRFDLDGSDLERNLSCFLGPGYATTFRAADRPFQLLVAFGGRPSPKRLDEVNGLLNSLRFD